MPHSQACEEPLQAGKDLRAANSHYEVCSRSASITPKLVNISARHCALQESAKLTEEKGGETNPPLFPRLITLQIWDSQGNKALLQICIHLAEKEKEDTLAGNRIFKICVFLPNAQIPRLQSPISAFLHRIIQEDEEESTSRNRNKNRGDEITSHHSGSHNPASPHHTG